MKKKKESPPKKDLKELSKKSRPQSLSKKQIQSPSRGKSPSEKTKKNTKRVIPQMTVLGSQNFDVLGDKMSIVDLADMPLKYVLKCISGIFKNRFVFITTHADGEIIGSGDAKKQNLTLQIQGVGLSTRHASLKFDGFKSFEVTDFGSQRGTWMNIPPSGSIINPGNTYYVGKHSFLTKEGNPLNQIQQLCIVNNCIGLTDILNHNGVTTINMLLQKLHTGFKQFPLTVKQKQQLVAIGDSLAWYDQNPCSKRLIVQFSSEAYKGIRHQIGFQNYIIFKSNSKAQLSQQNMDETIAKIIFQKGNFRLVSEGVLIFQKIKPNCPVKLKLYDHITIGDLGFQLTRFNIGTIEDAGDRPEMQDILIINQDLGISKHHLVSVFCVADGHGGSQCVQYLKQNLINVIKQNLKPIDNIKLLNEGIKILTEKIFFDLDYGFYKAMPQKAISCGATLLILLIIGCRIFVISLGDCRGLLGKNNKTVQICNPHKPSRPDQKLRIQNLGGFLQYDRLLGKMTISRCLGSFQYKSLQDYQNKLKGSPKSFIACTPDIKAFDVDAQTDEFILLSTDGLYQSQTSEQISSFIKQKSKGLEGDQTAQKMLKGLLNRNKQRGGSDNTAAVLIVLRKAPSGLA